MVHRKFQVRIVYIACSRPIFSPELTHETIENCNSDVLKFQTTKPLEETYKLRVILSKNRIYHAQAKGYLKDIEINVFI